MCQREEEAMGWKRRKEKEGEGLKIGEKERTYMTTKHRYHSWYVHCILLTVKLSKVGRHTLL